MYDDIFVRVIQHEPLLMERLHRFYVVSDQRSAHCVFGRTFVGFLLEDCYSLSQSAFFLDVPSRQEIFHVFLQSVMLFLKGLIDFQAHRDCNLWAEVVTHNL